MRSIMVWRISMERRRFLVRTGLTLGAAALVPKTALGAEKAMVPSDWNRVRDQFNLSRDHIHLAGFFLASHPTSVREAIDTHRRGFDENPFGYFVSNAERLEGAIATSAAEYLGARPADIAFTDSTSEGLG